MVNVDDAQSLETDTDIVRVAIIGSGLTGLVAAYLLSSVESQDRRICVEIFERASTLGMDSASISVQLDPLISAKHANSRTCIDPATGNKMLRIDVPMRAFTGGYYPQLLSLYNHLGISIEKTNFTYSFATATNPTRPTILYNGSNGTRGISLPAHLRSHIYLKASRQSLTQIAQHVVQVKQFVSDLLVLVLGYLQLLMVALWHNKLGHTTSLHHPLGSCTLRDLVQQPFPRPKEPPATWSALAVLVVEKVLRRIITLDRRFVRATLVPLFSAVMTSSSESVWDSPASQVLDYVALTLGKDHFVVRDGVRRVVASLLVHFEDPQKEDAFDPAHSKGKVWTDAEVQSVQYADGKAWIEVVHHKTSSSSSRQPNQMANAESPAESAPPTPTTQRHGGFDHLIFATQANQSATFLRQYRSSIDTASRQHPDTEFMRAGSQQLDAIIESLEAFKYEKSLVINHTDQALLPSSKSDWRDLNLVSPISTASTPSASTARRASNEAWTDLDSDTSGDETNDTEQEVSSPLSSSLSSVATPVLSPSDKSDWQARLSALYQTEPSRNSHSMATHILSQHSALPSSDAASPLLLQTTNPLPHLMPRADAVLSQTYFERAVITVPAHLARQRLFAQENGQLRLGELHKRIAPTMPAVWTCGSWSTGIPLLEGCVVSARLVALEIARLESLTLSSPI